MARISERNLRYRTKPQLAEDLCKVLCSDLHYGTKFCVLSEATWVWSEFYGKHKGCPWRSKKAMNIEDLRTLIHEHAVPKKELIEKLFELKSPSPRKVFNLMEKFCIGVLITKEEDRNLREAKLTNKMPECWDGNNVWARYEQVGIVAQQVAGGDATR